MKVSILKYLLYESNCVLVMHCSRGPKKKNALCIEIRNIHIRKYLKYYIGV